jgi:hypothetical protein
MMDCDEEGETVVTEMLENRPFDEINVGDAASLT